MPRLRARHAQGASRNSIHAAEQQLRAPTGLVKRPPSSFFLFSLGTLRTRSRRSGKIENQCCASFCHTRSAQSPTSISAVMILLMCAWWCYAVNLNRMPRNTVSLKDHFKRSFSFPRMQKGMGKFFLAMQPALRLRPSWVNRQAPNTHQLTTAV